MSEIYGKPLESPGGLTMSKLNLATATEDKVFNGRTFYAGDKTLRTGRAQVITEEEYTAATATPDKVFNGYTYYGGDDKEIKTGTALATASTAAAGDIVSGKTAYDSLGQLITGTSKFLQAGTISNLSNITYTVMYNNDSGSPKLFIGWILNVSTKAVVACAICGSATGTNAGTYTAGKKYQFDAWRKNAIVNSTFLLGQTQVQFTIDAFDYYAGGGHELNYVLIW